MTIRYFLFMMINVVFFTSCQKGVDWTATTSNTGSGTGSTGGSGSNGGTTGELLVKVVSVTGTETITTLYTYDASKRLITEDTKGTSGGLAIDSYQKFYRDANGRIYKVARLMKQTGIVSDTSYVYVNYPNGTTSNFTYTTDDITVGGFGTHDSTVYSWDAAGNITSSNNYMSSSFAPGVIIGTQRNDYAYANGNLTQQKSYADFNMTGSQSLVVTYNYTYDANTNPMIANGEFVLTGRTESASKNNVTKMDIIDATMPANSMTLTSSIKYGANNKPGTGTVTQSPQNRVSNYTFYYQ